MINHTTKFVAKYIDSLSLKFILTLVGVWIFTLVISLISKYTSIELSPSIAEFCFWFVVLYCFVVLPAVHAVTFIALFVRSLWLIFIKQKYIVSATCIILLSLILVVSFFYGFYESLSHTTWP